MDENLEYSSTQILNQVVENERFTAQMELMQQIFTEATDVFTLLTNLDLCFQKSHSIEGSDFCIFLKSDWYSVLINQAESLPQNLDYGTQVQSIASIQNNEKSFREIINTRDLIPNKMKTEENNFFLLLPIFNHSYVHGYFVTKNNFTNNFTMRDNHYGHTWTLTFGNSIERFRKQNMFKQMSKNKKYGLTTVLFFVDINKMKYINDKFGHLHGELAVKTIAAAAMEVIPRTWLPIRYGGDEFLIVGNSKNYNGEDYCKIITDRITKKNFNYAPAIFSFCQRWNIFSSSYFKSYTGAGCREM